MPNLEYLCKDCGHRFEQIRKFSDKQLRKCPECGGVIEQVISAPAVQFKGSGWYVTDYPKKGAGSGASSSSSSEGDSGTKEAKETKEGKDRKEAKDTKKDDKPKPDVSHKKHKKD
jgi:putative FmdB family regulatory protein